MKIYGRVNKTFVACQKANGSKDPQRAIDEQNVSLT